MKNNNILIKYIFRFDIDKNKKKLLTENVYNRVSSNFPSPWSEN